MVTQFRSAVAWQLTARRKGRHFIPDSPERFFRIGYSCLFTDRQTVAMEIVDSSIIDWASIIVDSSTIDSSSLKHIIT